MTDAQKIDGLQLEAERDPAADELLTCHLAASSQPFHRIQERAMQAYLLPQEHSSEARRVIGAATAPSDGLTHTLLWYRNESQAVFDDKIAELLVAERRIEDVPRYLRSLAAGVAG